jgi:hypothetical protein
MTFPYSTWFNKRMSYSIKTPMPISDHEMLTYWANKNSMNFTIVLMFGSEGEAILMRLRQNLPQAKLRTAAKQGKLELPLAVLDYVRASL